MMALTNNVGGVVKVENWSDVTYVTMRSASHVSRPTLAVMDFPPLQVRSKYQCFVDVSLFSFMSVLVYLLGYIFTRTTLASTGICRRCVSVCLCVLSVTRRYCIKTAKRRITQTTPRDNPGTLDNWRQQLLMGGTPFPENCRQKIRLPGLSRGVVCVILRLAVLIQFRLIRALA